MCKVSIIMPVYNKEKYVEKAIKSVLNQTEKDWELIVIDDGSTDSSADICDSFSDPRIKVYHVNNAGVSSARNRGISKAKGDYITFCDGDDTLHPQYLEMVFDPSVEMIVSGMRGVLSTGEELELVIPKYDGIITVKNICDSFYADLMKNGVYGFVAGKLVRRSVIEKYKIRFDETIRLAEDLDFFVKIYQKIDKIKFVQKAYYYYTHETREPFNIKAQDIPSQIIIQKRIEKWLKNEDSFSFSDKNRMSEKLTRLIYTYWISQDFKNYDDFLQKAEKLRKTDYIYRDVFGNFYMQLVLNLYRKKKDYLLYLVLKIRNIRKRGQR